MGAGSTLRRSRAQRARRGVRRAPRAVPVCPGSIRTGYRCSRRLLRRRGWSSRENPPDEKPELRPRGGTRRPAATELDEVFCGWRTRVAWPCSNPSNIPEGVPLRWLHARSYSYRTFRRAGCAPRFVAGARARAFRGWSRCAGVLVLVRWGRQRRDAAVAGAAAPASLAGAYGGAAARRVPGSAAVLLLSRCAGARHVLAAGGRTRAAAGGARALRW